MSADITEILKKKGRIIMKVLKNKRNGNTVSLEIEASVETITKAFDQAFQTLVKRSKVPGFRQGKTPRTIFEKHYGKSTIVQEGLPKAVNEAYHLAIQELDLPIVDYPKNVNIGEYKESEPVQFTCDVDVKPTVKVGKYKGLKVTQEPKTADEDKINEKINQLRDNASNYNEVQRASKEEDIVRLDIEASIDGVAFPQWTRKNMGVKVGLKNFGETFDKEISGLTTAEEKQFTVTYPADYSETQVAEKTVSFSIKVIEIREKVLPELNDEFAKKVSKFETFADFKKDLVATLSKENKEKSENKLHSDLIDAIVEDTKMDIPEGMITQEIDADIRYYESILSKSGSTLSSYLSLMGQNEEEFRKTLKEAALKRVQADLVLEEIALKENIKASDDELKAEIKKSMPNLKTDEEVDAHFEKINTENLRNTLTQRKTIDFVVENAKIKESK